MTSDSVEVLPKEVYCPMCEIIHENNTWCQVNDNSEGAGYENL